MEQRIGFFDSNILIAGSVSTHLHHAAFAARLVALQDGGGAMAAHSVAEAYNNLTNPSRYGLPPADAAVILNHAARTYTVVTLTAEETLAVMNDAARRGLTGAIIYDALILACVRKSNADVIYTWNVKHFRLVAPDLADRIIEP